MNDYEEQLRQLFGEMQPQDFQLQSMPQFTQGLLGDSGQTPQLQDIMARGQSGANQMAQFAQPQATNNSDIAQRQAMSQQLAQQLAQRQQQQESQAGNLLGMLAKFYLTGGMG